MLRVRAPRRVKSQVGLREANAPARRGRVAADRDLRRAGRGRGALGDPARGGSRGAAAARAAGPFRSRPSPSSSPSRRSRLTCRPRPRPSSRRSSPASKTRSRASSMRGCAGGRAGAGPPRPDRPAPARLRRCARSYQLGFRSLDAYARERLAMSPRKARALLRLERACALAPALGEAWRSGRITCVPVPGARPPRARRRLGALPLRLGRARGGGDGPPTGGRRGACARVGRLRSRRCCPTLPEGVQIGARTHGRGDDDVWVANVPADVGRLFRACLGSRGAPPEHRPRRRARGDVRPLHRHLALPHAPRASRVRARRLALHGAGLHVAAEPARASRAVPLGGRRRRAREPGTLCAAHHQRGVHAGLIRIAGRAPDGLVFELPLGRFRSGDRVTTRIARSPVAECPARRAQKTRAATAGGRRFGRQPPSRRFALRSSGRYAACTTSRRAGRSER